MKSCPICGEQPKESFQGKYVGVLKCGNPLCGHLYASTATADQGVQSHPNPAAEHRKYRRRNERLVRFWSQAGFLNKNSKVLDFGSGSGHIAAAIREFQGSASNITCIEADPLSQQWLKDCTLDVVDDLEQCSNDFTAVLLVELIEHIEAPVLLLQKLKKHMALDAKLFLSTPCGETRVGSRNTNAYDTPEHIHFFTERSLQLALRKAGFKKLQFLVVPAIYPYGKDMFSTAIAHLKGIARRVHGRLFGYSHLIVMVE